MDNPPADLSTNACGLPYGTTTCASCASTSCCAESNACVGDPDFCAPYESCLGACNGDPACRSKCTIDHPVPAVNAAPVSALSACLVSHCEDECGLACGGFAGYLSMPDAATGAHHALRRTGAAAATSAPAERQRSATPSGAAGWRAPRLIASGLVRRNTMRAPRRSALFSSISPAPAPRNAAMALTGPARVTSSGPPRNPAPWRTWTSSTTSPPSHPLRVRPCLSAPAARVPSPTHPCSLRGRPTTPVSSRWPGNSRSHRPALARHTAGRSRAGLPAHVRVLDGPDQRAALVERRTLLPEWKEDGRPCPGDPRLRGRRMPTPEGTTAVAGHWGVGKSSIASSVQPDGVKSRLTAGTR